VSWPEPYKFVRIAQDPKITIDSSEKGVVSVSSNVPLKGVVLSVPLSEGGNDAQWGDNYIDIVPGQVSKFPVEQLDGRSVKARWLCDW
jgi:beta-mannosidase